MSSKMAEPKTLRGKNGRSYLKAWVGAVSIVVMGIVVSPVAQNWSNAPEDNFPLSYYPMFTKSRDDLVKIIHVVGLDADGNPYRIRYNVLGSGGMNQVRKQLRRQVKAGDADALCRDVAKYLSERKSGPLSRIESVAVVTSSFDLDQFVQGIGSPSRQIVEATCPVE